MSSYKHFTAEERQKIQESLNKGKRNSEIARELNRNRSSVGREIRRNRNKDGSYNWWRATTLYIVRRKKSVRKLRVKCVKLRAFAIEGLGKRWSPEIITQRYKKENPGEPLSHSTIYRAVKNKELPDITAKTHLRRGGKRKNAHTQAIKPTHTIHDRPSEAESRERIGDLEGDTVSGAIGKGCLVTLVDRRSRMLYAAKSHSRDSHRIEEAFKTSLDGVNVNKRTTFVSITLDNGSEFSRFPEIEKNHGTTVYFADPHSPWQRGSNENINGLLRFFVPKGTNFHDVSDDEVNSVISLINNRPRKCLDWLSPIGFLNMLNFCESCCT
jgi:IS30 family transposase